MASLQGFRCEFPTHGTGNYFSGTGNLGARTGNLSAGIEITPDEIFGTKNLWMMSALTPKSGHCSTAKSTCPLCANGGHYEITALRDSITQTKDRREAIFLRSRLHLVIRRQRFVPIADIAAEFIGASSFRKLGIGG